MFGETVQLGFSRGASPRVPNELLPPLVHSEVARLTSMPPYLSMSAKPNFLSGSSPAGCSFCWLASTPGRPAYPARTSKTRLGPKVCIQPPPQFLPCDPPDVEPTSPIGEVGSTSGGSQGRNWGGGWIHTFGPSLVLDVRAGYAGRPGVDASQQNEHPAGLDPLKKFGFADIDKYGGILVNLATSEWTNGGNNSFGTRGDAPRENPNWTVSPNISSSKTNHNLRAGFWFIDAKRIQTNTFQ